MPNSRPPAVRALNAKCCRENGHSSESQRSAIAQLAFRPRALEWLGAQANAAVWRGRAQFSEQAPIALATRQTPTEA